MLKITDAQILFIRRYRADNRQIRSPCNIVFNTFHLAPQINLFVNRGIIEFSHILPKTKLLK